MKCPDCGGHIDLPAFHLDAYCWVCGKAFQLTADYGFFSYTAEVYQNMNNGEVRVVDELTGGEKGQKDCQMGAVDPLALMEVGKVAGFGGRKYERYNFTKGYRWSLSYDALQRHLMAFWNGEDVDPESGHRHLAHACWHSLALLTFSMRSKGTDDRFPQ